MEVVVVGGDAAGMSAASQIKRRIGREAHVIALEKSGDVSYSACSMPYNIALMRDTDDLLAVRAEDFINRRGIDLRLFNEAINLNPKNHEVTVKDHRNEKIYTIRYDKLMIATGASAIVPPVKGLQREGVFTLKELNDARRIKEYIRKHLPKKAILIGAGFVNLELSETFHKLGMEVIILEKMPTILPLYEEEIRNRVLKELDKHNIKVLTGVEIQRIDDPLSISTNAGTFKGDLINIAIGIKPNTHFLVDSGVTVDHRGAIIIDRYARTNQPNIYAGGDCALIYHRLLNRNVYIPLGTNANKIGRLAGANICGANEEFPGIVGSNIFKLFNIGIAKTGLSLEEAKREGYNAFKTTIKTRMRAHGYPNEGTVTISLITEKGSGKLLGGQIVSEGEGAMRINSIATALYGGFSIKDVQAIDFAYAPPYSPVWDPILVCANQAAKGV